MLIPAVAPGILLDRQPRALLSKLTPRRGTSSQALLEAGADVKTVDDNDNTALHYAAGYGYMDTAQQLVDRHGCVERFEGGRGPLALHGRKRGI